LAAAPLEVLDRHWHAVEPLFTPFRTVSRASTHPGHSPRSAPPGPATRDRISAGQTVTFRPTWISLTDEYGTFSAPCQLPATTTRMVAVLWSDADRTTGCQEFATTYTFVTP
jgi:hypothetical protein